MVTSSEVGAFVASTARQVSIVECVEGGAGGRRCVRPPGTAYATRSGRRARRRRARGRGARPTGALPSPDGVARAHNSGQCQPGWSGPRPRARRRRARRPRTRRVRRAGRPNTIVSPAPPSTTRRSTPAALLLATNAPTSLDVTIRSWPSPAAGHDPAPDQAVHQRGPEMAAAAWMCADDAAARRCGPRARSTRCSRCPVPSRPARRTRVDRGWMFWPAPSA